MNEINEIKEVVVFRDNWIRHIHDLQDQLCYEIEKIDGTMHFTEDNWERATGGGGGRSRVMEQGTVFEKGGVNSSVVYGMVDDTLRNQLKMDGHQWFACGLSLVLHPINPYVPTVHANWRYFELYNEDGDITDRWFGGGTDLTPYYLFPEDAVHFHQTLKEALDPFGENGYPEFKKNCDQYFANHHRNQEMRGIGGIFYDYLRPVDAADMERLFSFQAENGKAFQKAYFPIVQKRKDMPFSEREIQWQEIRRGRYVEFNLIHDRGTLFGLKTSGRTESILMSLPPRARWMYNYQPLPGTPEHDLLEVCLHPKTWVK